MGVGGTGLPNDSASQPDHVMACPTVLPDKTTIRHPDGVFQVRIAFEADLITKVKSRSATEPKQLIQ